MARVHFVASENSLRVLARSWRLRPHRPARKTAWRRADKDGPAFRCGHRRVDRQRQPPFEWHDRSAVFDGHAGGHRQRPGQLADRPRSRCHAQGAPPAGPLRARNALQPHSPAQHDAGCGGRRDHLPLHSGLLQQARRLDGDGAPVCRSRAGAYRAAAAGGVCLESKKNNWLHSDSCIDRIE